MRAGPRRKMDFQTRVSQIENSAGCGGRHRFLYLQDLVGDDNLQLVDRQFAVRGQRNGEVRERPRRRAFDLRSIGSEFAAMTRAGDLTQFRLPLRDAAEVRAHCRDCVKALRRANNVNLLFLKKGNGVDRV